MNSISLEVLERDFEMEEATNSSPIELEIYESDTLLSIGIPSISSIDVLFPKSGIFTLVT